MIAIGIGLIIYEIGNFFFFIKVKYFFLTKVGQDFVVLISINNFEFFIYIKLRTGSDVIRNGYIMAIYQIYG